MVKQSKSKQRKPQVRRQYVIKFDATRLKEKHQNKFLNMLQSDDAQNLILKKNDNGLIMIGRVSLYDLIEYELKSNKHYRDNIRLTLIIRNIDTNSAQVVDGLKDIQLNDVEQYRLFDRTLRF